MSSITTLANPLQWIIDWVRGEHDTEDGFVAQVSAEKALRHAPVWHCINKICGNMSILPFQLMQEKPSGFFPRTSDERYYAVAHRPNDFMTTSAFISMMQSHAILWGNARAYIHRGDDGSYQFIPLLPDRTTTVIANGQKIHLTKPMGTNDPINLYKETVKKNSDIIAMYDDEVLHIPGFGLNGMEGLSLLRMASISWSTGHDSDLRARVGMKKGFSAGVVAEAPPNAFKTEKEAKKYQDDLNDYLGGPKNQGKAALLINGVKLSGAKSMMSNVDAQFIQQRRFQREEAALWLMLEQILGDESNVSYNSLEQKNLAFLTNCLFTWINKWEEELKVKLLTKNEIMRGFRFVADTEKLLQADFKSKVDAYCRLIQHLVYSPNEVRRALRKNDRPGGDTYVNPNTSSDKKSASSDNSDTSNVTTQQANKKALALKMKHLAQVERKRIEGYASSKQFIKKAETFYNKWQKNLLAATEECGADPDAVDYWIDESISAVAAIAKDPSSMGQVLDQMPSRIESFLEKAYHVPS